LTTRTFAAGGFLLVESTTRTDDDETRQTYARRADGAPLTYEYRRGANVEATATWTYSASGATKVEQQSIRRTIEIKDTMGRVVERREDQPKDGVDDWIQQ